MANEHAVKVRDDRRSVPGFQDFAVTVLPAGGAATIRVTGDLDCHTAPQLRAVLAGVVVDGVRQVTLDLSGTPFMDSTGLSVVVGGLKRLREQGGNLVLEAPSPATLRLFEVTGLSSVFDIA